MTINVNVMHAVLVFALVCCVFAVGVYLYAKSRYDLGFNRGFHAGTDYGRRTPRAREVKKA